MTSSLLDAMTNGVTYVIAVVLAVALKVIEHLFGKKRTDAETAKLRVDAEVAEGELEVARQKVAVDSERSKVADWKAFTEALEKRYAIVSTQVDKLEETLKQTLIEAAELRVAHAEIMDDYRRLSRQFEELEKRYKAQLAKADG